MRFNNYLREYQMFSKIRKAHFTDGKTEVRRGYARIPNKGQSEAQMPALVTSIRGCIRPFTMGALPPSHYCLTFSAPHLTLTR